MINFKLNSNRIKMNTQIEMSFKNNNVETSISEAKMMRKEKKTKSTTIVFISLIILFASIIQGCESAPQYFYPNGRYGRRSDLPSNFKMTPFEEETSSSSGTRNDNKELNIPLK